MYTETHHHLSHMYLSADEWMVLLKHLEVFLGSPHTLLQHCMDLGYIENMKGSNLWHVCRYKSKYMVYISGFCQL